MFSLVNITNKLARHSFSRYEKDAVISYYRRWSMSNDIERSRRSKSNQENIPPILKLPPEVLDRCWGYLERLDLLQVPRVCRVFWFTSRYRIFQSLTIDLSPESPPELERQTGFGFKRTKRNTKTFEPAGFRITSFYSSPGARELWDMVQSWTLIAEPTVKENLSLLDQDWQGLVQMVAMQSLYEVFQLLPRSCNLRTLEIVALDLGREHCVTLQSLPALETLKLIGCLFPSSSHFQRPLKLKELAIIGSFSRLPVDRYLVLVLCNPAHLEKLTLTHFFVSHTVLSVLASMEDFPRLTCLNIAIKPRCRGHFFKFLGAIPSLATLRILPWSANITPDRPLPALSSFRSYYGYPDLLSHIVPGRPVDSVTLVLAVATTPENGGLTDAYAIHIDLIPTLLDISRSAVPVRSLRIECFLPTLYRLITIANRLPGLRRLDLKIITASSQFNSEDMTTMFDPSFKTCDSNPFEPLDTIQGLLSWFAAGFSPLPPKLETLRLSYSSRLVNGVRRVEGIEKQDIIYSLHSRYPSLREVEIGPRYWWREGAHWSCRQETL